MQKCPICKRPAEEEARANDLACRLLTAQNTIERLRKELTRAKKHTTTKPC